MLNLRPRLPRGPSRALRLLGLLALVSPLVSAQIDPSVPLNFPITGTLSPGPQIPGALQPSMVLSMNADDQVVSLAPPAVFAVPGITGPNWVSAITSGRDRIPPDLEDVTTQDRWVLVEFTVSNTSTGLPGSPVEAQWLSDGASSDVFGYYKEGSLVVGPFHISNHWGIDPASDLCGLSWRSYHGIPAYLFTLNLPQGGVCIPWNGGMRTVTSSTIFRTDGAMFTIPMDYDQIFHADDKIGALACDEITGQIVFTLEAGSPTLAGTASLPPCTPSDLLSYILPGQPFGIHPPGSIFLWGEHDEFGLDDGDLLNGLRIGDPMNPRPALGTSLVSSSYTGPAIPVPGDSTPYASLTVTVSGSAPTDGGVLRRVFMGLGTPMTLSVLPSPGPWSTSAHDYVLYAFPGIPAVEQSAYWPELVAVANPFEYPGALELVSSFSGIGLATTGPAPIPLAVPGSIFPSVFTYQAVYFTPGSAVNTTNAITVAID